MDPIITIIVFMSILVALAIAVIGWTIAASNRFKVLLVKIGEADSGIGVALIKRYDTLTKLMNVVKAYAGHETEVLSKLVKLRSSMGVAEKVEASIQMDAMAKQLNVIAEGYPELRSSENYRQLQDAIVDAEDHLQAARRVYNMNVSAFNQSIVRFPASIIANRAGHTLREFFEVEEKKRADVKIDL